MIDFCRESLETRLRIDVTKVSYVGLGKSSVVGLPVVLHHIALTKLPQEVLVMGDDYELKVCVISTLIDDTTSRMVSAHFLRADAEMRRSLTQQDWPQERRYSPCPERLWARPTPRYRSFARKSLRARGE